MWGTPLRASRTRNGGSTLKIGSAFSALGIRCVLLAIFSFFLVLPSFLARRYRLSADRENTDKTTLIYVTSRQRTTCKTAVRIGTPCVGYTQQDSIGFVSFHLTKAALLSVSGAIGPGMGKKERAGVQRCAVRPTPHTMRRPRFGI
jgi:hypothetical protein